MVALPSNWPSKMFPTASATLYNDNVKALPDVGDFFVVVLVVSCKTNKTALK